MVTRSVTRWSQDSHRKATGQSWEGHRTVTSGPSLPKGVATPVCPGREQTRITSGAFKKAAATCNQHERVCTLPDRVYPPDTTLRRDTHDTPSTLVYIGFPLAKSMQNNSLAELGAANPLRSQPSTAAPFPARRQD